jgi:transcriptional regulator with XRE-family HTH domain
MKKAISDVFGNVVRKRRIAKKLSQQVLADRAGISVKMWGLIERKMRNPTINLAQSIAHVLGVPLWVLIKEAEDFQKNEKPANLSGKGNFPI